LSNLYRIFLAAASIGFSVLACSSKSTEELLETRLTTLHVSEADLVFEERLTSSAATGACRSMWIDQWYGSQKPFSEFQLIYEAQIVDQGWAISQEDESEIWHLRTSEGLFSLLLRDFSSEINPERDAYTLSESTLQALEAYPTVFLISIGHMGNVEEERCYE
jgi:hypothetical protein